MITKVHQNIYSYRFDKKRTPEFVTEIQAIIDNDLNKSTRSIAIDIGISEFLIRQVVYEGIRYFSFKMRKGQFLSEAMKDKRKVRAAKLLD